MADIELRVHGDGSEGKEALDHVAEGAHGAHEAAGSLKEGFEELEGSLTKTLTAANLFTSAIEKGAETLKEFAAESVKAYAAQEQADRNLAMMAGSLTASLKEQAEEFEKTYGVAATVTEKVQTLALAHGADRDQVKELTEATTKWAAITGTDAAGAAESLVRAVEMGRHSAKQLGIEWEATGSKTEDMKNAIEALNERLGNADPNADATLQGRTNKAALAMERLQKGFGGWIASIESKYGVLDKLGQSLNYVADHAKAFASVAGTVGTAGVGGLFNASDSQGIPVEPEPVHDFPSATGDTADTNRKFDESVKKRHEALAKLKDEQLTFTQQEDKFDEDLVDKNAEALNKEWEAAVDHEEKTQKLSEDSAEKRAAIDALADDDELARQQKQQQLELDYQDKFQQDMIASTQRFNEHKQELQEAADRKLLKREEEVVAQAARGLASIAEEALNEALGDQGLKWQKVVGKLADLTLSIAGTAIGSYVGGPAGGQIGGAAGGLAGYFADYGINQIHHEGGWVERYHRGGYPGILGPSEVPIIAEAGEAVLSRRDVANMGGPAGVDRARSGSGGGMQVTIQTMDGASMRDVFEGRGGRSIVNAMRVGRGSLPALLGGGS